VTAATQSAAQKEPAVEKAPLEVSVAATAAPAVSAKQDADATIAAALADIPVVQAPVPAVAAVQPGSQQTDAPSARVSSSDQNEATMEDEDATEAVSRNEAEYAATASLADPNDYSIAADGTIEIQATETLGHYADWLGIKTQRLRDINGLSGSAQLVVGRRIKLDLSKANKASFETRRIAYHREIQDAFFVRYRVTSTTEHTLQSGESVWKIAQATYNVPVWLLRQYNPDLDFGRVKPGMSIIVPKLQPIARGADNRDSVAVTAG
jgi:membrane-bound lytic murein transglycosylase D